MKKLSVLAMISVILTSCKATQEYKIWEFDGYKFKVTGNGLSKDDWTSIRNYLEDEVSLADFNSFGWKWDTAKGREQNPTVVTLAEPRVNFSYFCLNGKYNFSDLNRRLTISVNRNCFSGSIFGMKKINENIDRLAVNDLKTQPITSYGLGAGEITYVGIEPNTYFFWWEDNHESFDSEIKGYETIDYPSGVDTHHIEVDVPSNSIELKFNTLEAPLNKNVWCLVKKVESGKIDPVIRTFHIVKQHDGQLTTKLHNFQKGDYVAIYFVTDKAKCDLQQYGMEHKVKVLCEKKFSVSGEKEQVVELR
jgi:hypothetical protein